MGLSEGRPYTFHLDLIYGLFKPFPQVCFHCSCLSDKHRTEILLVCKIWFLCVWSLLLDPGRREHLKSPKSRWWQMSTAFPDGREQKWDLKEKTHSVNPLSFSSFGAKCWPIRFLFSHHPLSFSVFHIVVCSPEIHPFCFPARWNYRKQTLNSQAHNFLTTRKGVGHGLPSPSSTPTTSFQKQILLKHT